MDDVSNQTTILETSMALRAIGKASDVDVMERLSHGAPELHPLLEEVVEDLPHVLGRMVRDLDSEIAADQPGHGRLCGLYDPRNYREICDGLTDVAESGDEILTRAVSRVLEGILPDIRAVSMFLISMKRRGPLALSYCDGLAKNGDASLSVDQLDGMLGRMKGWHRANASAVVISGRAASETPASGESVTSPPHAGRARISVPEVQRFGALPSELSAPVELDKWASIGGQMPDLLHQAMSAAIRACSTVLQQAFVSTLDGMRVRVVEDGTDHAWFDPGSRTIYVGSALESPVGLVPELAQFIDQQLSVGGGFRSSEEGAGLHAFVCAAKPLYEPVVDGVVRDDALSLLELLAPGVEWSSSQDIDVIVDGLSFVRGVDKDRVSFELSQEKRVDLELDHGPLMWHQRVLLDAISDSVHLPEGGERMEVDSASALKLFMDMERERLLSGPEVFSRFFSQYCRLLTDQRKYGFGPKICRGDLDLHGMRRLVPIFLQVLYEEQRAAIERRAYRLGTGKLMNTVAAGVVSVAASVFMFFFPGRD